MDLPDLKTQKTWPLEILDGLLPPSSSPSSSPSSCPSSSPCSPSPSEVYSPLLASHTHADVLGMATRCVEEGGEGESLGGSAILVFVYLYLAILRWERRGKGSDCVFLRRSKERKGLLFGTPRHDTWSLRRERGRGRERVKNNVPSLYLSLPFSASASLSPSLTCRSTHYDSSYRIPLSKLPGVRMRVTTTIPISAGLGSSAAYSVGVTGALLTLRSLILSDIAMDEEKNVLERLDSLFPGSSNRRSEGSW